MKPLLNNVIFNNHYNKYIHFKRFIRTSYNFMDIKILNKAYVYKNENITLSKCHFSFMKNVIEQVKKDMKENKKYQEALKELKEKTEIEDKKIKWKKIIEKNINFCINIKEKNIEAVKIIYNDINHFFTYYFENIFLLKYIKNLSIKYFIITQKNIIQLYNKCNELKDKFNDNTAFIKLDKWRQEMAIKRKEKNNIDEKKYQKIDEQYEQNQKIDEQYEQKVKNLYEQINEINEQVNEKIKNRNEIIIAKESTWEKFGSKLKDMPFLNNFFENPIFGKLFGESELAAALREMKEHDKNFKLSELIFLFEFVISKHIIECYLNGDAESLRLHCGPTAFKSLNVSINERKKKKVFLDKNVLIYKNHELKGAQRMEESLPWFIFTFHAQQINCLRNLNDEIIEGKIDDIREVVYTIALSKHPKPETEGLLYPYIIREFAIIGNTPSW